MSNPLVSPIFTTGPKDKLAAADIYKVDTKKVITSIQEISNKVGIDINSLLGGAGVDNLGKLVSLKNGSLTVDKDAIAARLISTSKSITSSFRELNKDARERMLSGFEDYGQLGIKLNGVVQYVKDVDYSGLSSVGKFVNDYVKSPIYEVIDDDAVSSLITGVVKEAGALGVNGLLPQLTNGLSGRVLTKVVNGSFPTLLKNNDLTSMSHIANGLLGKSLDFIYPQFAQDLASAFGYKKITDVFNQNADYLSVLAILSAVNSNWDVHIHKNSFTPGSEITGMSIVKLQKSSKAFKDLILQGIKTEGDFNRRKNYALIAQYPNEGTVDDQIARFFPAVGIRMKLSNPYNPPKNKNKTVDPRILAKMGEKLLGSIAERL